MNKVKIAFLGFGNIGLGTYELLEKNRKTFAARYNTEISLEKVLVRDLNKKRRLSIPEGKLTDKISDVTENSEIDIVVEFMGGIKPAKDYVTEALKNGKTVVTANKELVSKYWFELHELARKTGAGFYYEASVAGGIPIIKAINESLQANEIKEIMGIINGTTNYILTKMSEEGQDYGAVLEEAKQLGYAEPDPTADVEAFDAQYKLSILSTIAFKSPIPLEKVYREGISQITAEDIEYGKEFGFALKLLAIAKNVNGILEARVHPTFLPLSHPLASVREAFNAVFVKGDAVGNMMFYGRGAGDMPTGSAVVSDILTAINSKNHHRYAQLPEDSNDSVVISDDWNTEYFLRLSVKDKPGVLAKIAGLLGKYEVSIASVIQKDKNREFIPLVFVTHKASEKGVGRALAEIKELVEVEKVESVIRVER